MVTAQVDRLKAARSASACAARRLLGKAHFKVMVDARITSRQSTAIVLSEPFSLQFKQLQADYASSYMDEAQGRI
jgi:hypothetical protein